MGKLALLVSLETMVAPDPQAPLEPEVSLESWDSPDPKDLLVTTASPVREVKPELLVVLVLLVKMVTLVLLDPKALLVLKERKERVALPDLMDSKVCLELRELLVSLERLVTRVCPVRLEVPAPVDPEVKEVSQASVVAPDLLAPQDLVEPMVLLVTMVLGVRLVLLVPLVVWELQVCRECPESVAQVATPGPREIEVMVAPREPTVAQEKTACVV
ncbi:hypothetical protein J4Q44_G00277090 [Coregonus suidteri]|uniref:Uncharacterized protein n=1 Tax=Coregonus suidteri TaxID=861788 RepID=A0AAN8QK42_9TELE